MRRIVLLVLGFGALALGGVGLVLPVLPTTPFVLCAAGCFASSSPKLYQKLANARYFGEYIQNYKNKTGIGPAARWGGIAFLWAALILSGVIAGRPLMWGILLVVGAAVSIHILTIRRRMPAGEEAELPQEGETPPSG